MYRRIACGSAARPHALAVACFERTRTVPACYAGLDRAAGGALAAALARSEFNASVGQVVTLYPSKGPSRLLVIGLGPRQAGPTSPTDALRQAGAKLVRTAFEAGIESLRVQVVDALGDWVSPADAGRALVEGVMAANFEYTTFRGAGQAGERDKPKPAPPDLTLAVESPMVESCRRAITVGESANMARELAATPPNIANPAYLAAFCRSMARKVGLKCKVLDARQARKLGMGGLLAVGGAGSSPPCLIALEWTGGGRHAQERPLALVGKAITFDTGGYSIKPADSMDRMKYDKCGAMAVIGAMHAAARLKVPKRVVGVIPAAENLISNTAYRPADILKLCNGVTVEVLNTDAEGRLILGDALAWTGRTYQPHTIVDLATLTGGCVVALGSYCAGCFCDDEVLRQRLLRAGSDTGEKLWPLPLWEEHRQAIKGTHGDIVNSAGREASPITAAAFLSYFTGPKGQPRTVANRDQSPAWAHLDIAGVSDVKKDTALYANGPTGFGVRLLARLLAEG